MERQNSKKKNIIIGSIVGVLLLIVGVSYGFFVSSGKQDKFITFKAGACLSITITEESDAISLANIYPVTIEEGLTYTPYTFTIKNNCDNIAPYQISLESLDFKDNTLSGDYLRVSLEDSEGRINTNILSSLNEAEKTIENSYDARLLYSGVLNNQGSTSFKLRMWLDYEATKEQAASKVYKSKIAVSARSDEQLTDEIFTINYTEKSKEEGVNGYYNSYSTTVNISDKKDNNITAKYCVGSERCIPDTNVELTNNSFDYTYNNGNNILCTQAKDSIGNQSIIVCNEEIKIDTEAPSITYELADNTPGENSYYKELQIRLAGSDTGSGVSKIKYCVTESTCEPTNETTNNQVITLDSSSNPQKICSIVIDNNNNESSVICSETYKVDTNNPNIEVSLATSTTAANGWYKAVSIKGEASDSESGIGSIKYCTTTSETCEPDSSTTASSIDVPLSNNASAQKVCFKAIDNSGRESEVKCSGEYKVDNSTSTVSFGVASQTTGENGWYKALSIKVSATNNYSGIIGVKYCTTTGSTCTPSSTVSNNGSVPLGTNASAQRVCANATDGKGETTSTTCSGTYKVDKTAPTISTFYIGGSGNPASINSTSTSVYITFGASDVAAYCIKTNNSSSGCTWTAATSSPINKSYTLSGTGTQTLYAFIKDKAGNISAVKSDSVNVLTGKNIILQNNTIDTSRKSGSFTEIYTADTAGKIFEGPADDYGTTTYFFAGANPNNWVKFASKWWRIIRINGDGSIRLIYAGSDATKAPQLTGEDTQIGTSAFNTGKNDNAYLGYMYGTVGSDNYNDTHANINSSTIKGVLDTWYENSIKNNTAYSSKIETNIGFCGDRTTYDGTGAGTVNTSYKAGVRRVLTLKCAQSKDMYTISSANSGNKALSYPIGLITMDEVAFSGAFGSKYNTRYWLYTNQAYWTMTPAFFNPDGGGTAGYTVKPEGAINRNEGTNSVLGVRPVINLKASTVFSSGNGTTGTPYVVS